VVDHRAHREVPHRNPAGELCVVWCGVVLVFVTFSWYCHTYSILSTRLTPFILPSFYPPSALTHSSLPSSLLPHPLPFYPTALFEDRHRAARWIEAEHARHLLSHRRILLRPMPSHCFPSVLIRTYLPTCCRSREVHASIRLNICLRRIFIHKYYLMIVVCIITSFLSCVIICCLVSFS
jgi:hypothetical protein